MEFKEPPRAVEHLAAEIKSDYHDYWLNLSNNFANSSPTTGQRYNPVAENWQSFNPTHLNSPDLYRGFAYYSLNQRGYNIKLFNDETFAGQEYHAYFENAGEKKRIATLLEQHRNLPNPHGIYSLLAMPEQADLALHLVALQSPGPGLKEYGRAYGFNITDEMQRAHPGIKAVYRMDPELVNSIVLMRTLPVLPNRIATLKKRTVEAEAMPGDIQEMKALIDRANLVTKYLMNLVDKGVKPLQPEDCHAIIHGFVGHLLAEHNN